MDSTLQLEFIRRGGRVKRFHGFHLLMENPVGHHTFNLIGILVACVAPYPLRAELLLSAYMHDIAECITGDIPAPFKRKVDGLRDAMEAEEARLLKLYGLHPPELTEQEQRWLKLADSLDGAYHCFEERRLGNTTLDRIFWTFMEYVDDLLFYGDVDCAGFRDLYIYLEERWAAVGGPRSDELERMPHS